MNGNIEKRASDVIYRNHVLMPWIYTVMKVKSCMLVKKCLLSEVCTPLIKTYQEEEIRDC